MTRLLPILLLAACTPPPPVVATPHLVAYTCEEQRQAAAELDAPPPKPMLDRLVADYGTMRAETRALRNEPEPEGCEP